MQTAKCTPDRHTALKDNPERMRAECLFLGVNDFGHTLLELYNCTVCRSTLSVLGIGPVKFYDNEEP